VGVEVGGIDVGVDVGVSVTVGVGGTDVRVGGAGVGGTGVVVGGLSACVHDGTRIRKLTKK